MADMPSEFYLPAFGFLVTLGLGLVTAVKVLYSQNQIINAKFVDIAVRDAERLTANTEVLRGTTDALLKLAQVQGTVHG